MLKLIKYLKGYKFKTVCGPLFKLIEAVFELITPLVVAWVIDQAIPRGKEGDYSGLITGGGIILALGVFGLGFALVAQFFASRASMGFGTNLRRELYKHINSFSYAELDKFSTASLITRLTSDVNQAQTAVAMFIRLVLRSPFIIVGAIIMTIFINAKMSLIFVGATLILGAVLFIIMKTTMPRYKLVQSKLDEVSLKTYENLSGARVVRAFAAEPREKAAFDAASDVLAKTSIKVSAISALLNPLTYAVLNIGIILVLYFGGKSVYAGDLTQGEIIALVNYMTQILNAMVVFANLIVIFTKASASAARINEIFAVKPTLFEGDGATPDFSASAVQINDLSFSYPESSSLSLENINLTINRGTNVGVLGGTGSGKTTLVNLITRLYDATSGSVKIFGNDVKNYTGEELFSIFNVAPQKAVLFAGSIRENIQWGAPDASDEQITAALKSALAYDFVFNSKGGLDAKVAQGGKNFSGGQRQRLTIARALVSSPEILILDDSSSALDFATDAALRHELEKLRREKKMTTITISQRATTLSHCDFIIVMDDGKIAGLGTHDELIKTCDVYREIYSSQNNKEEERA